MYILNHRKYVVYFADSTLTSLDEYVESLTDFSDVKIQPRVLAVVRSLREKTAVKDYIKVTETYQAVVQTFLDVGLLDLWK